LFIIGWYLDRRTILHEFYYASDQEECGTCVATWLSRKNVNCKWRRLSDDNDYSEEEEESESESEQLEDRKRRAAIVVTPVKNQSLEESDEDTEQSNIGGTSWWDDDSDTSEDENDVDYKPHVAKKQRSTRPCEATEAMFGKKRIVKGGVYEKRVGHDVWLVKVIKFIGKGARCHIIYYLHAAISDCFPQYDGDCIREDRRTVVNESSIRDSDFLQIVTESKADFELCRKCAVFNLRCDKKNKVIFELKRRRLREPTNSMVTKRNVTTKPTELVLFAGIGGSSLGDKQAGFDVKWLVENDHLAAASLKINHSDATIYEEDVELFLSKCEEGKEGYPTVGEVDNIQGSPSCRGFSRLNRGGKYDDKNNLLSQQMVRATKILRPLTGYIENVTGMLDTKHMNHVINILQGLTELDYQVRIAVHNSCHFGVPQRRQRVIFTYARGDIRLPDMPVQTHKEGSYVTLRDAIQDLQSIPCDKSGSGLIKLSNGSVTYNHIASSNPTKGTKLLSLDEPVNTMTTQTSPLHPIHKHRTLSIRELARLFDLPDNKQFFGNWTSMKRQIGNSVPVKLAKSISQQILEVHKEYRNKHNTC